MSSQPDMRVDYHDAVGVVSLTGEVDIVQAHALRDRLLGAVRNEDLGLVVDLSEATYIDSVGVSLLFELAERLTERQLRLAVVIPEDGLVERVLRIVNLASVAEIHPNVDDALADDRRLARPSPTCVGAASRLPRRRAPRRASGKSHGPTPPPSSSSSGSAVASS